MSPCEGCHAGCCRSFAVPVTGADILRIQRDHQLSFWDFVCRWEDPEGRIARNYAPHFRFSDEPETPFVVCLTHAASKNFPQTSKCQFLVEEPPTEAHPMGTAHCGIYHSRPSACRAFPTKFNETNELAVIYDVPPSGRDANQHPAYGLCSREWEPADLDPLELLPALAVAQFEMRFFHQLAQLWNRQPRSWAMFPDFLTLVYSNRIVREPAQVEEEPHIIAFPTVKDSPDQPQRRAA
ncbi:MAG: YkgJ family cysteine cluster protein [Planctomycetaceae bacterium]|nr:YkgJ family cysteine cluster protein [Planctomycetaceae bacterium]